MLTGVMLLQVRTTACYSPPVDLIQNQAGRYYSKPSPPLRNPEAISNPSSTTTDDVTRGRRHERQSSLQERSSTPFRELTEDEAAELDTVEE
jgi:hypothetical protein